MEAVLRPLHEGVDCAQKARFLARIGSRAVQLDKEND